MKITICRKSHFNAAHKLYNPIWSKEKNLDVFGRCSYENYHGHNYELIVKFEGEIDQDTGMVMDLSDLKKIIVREVEDVLDHKNLNLDIDYFKDKIPSTENLAVFIWNKLNDSIELEGKLSIVLYETPRNFVEYSGG
ncbi:MAG: 6-pyruvoyl trahydropterin synthase family protein [Flavobacteriaceae bacterium]|jgi:6-pyruvoyltetrahydropterin/6-carboxytetrahydropterin synthase|tara:strand:- start:199 stop:609 length:411 start_codon:yes stop_codon:yes gene_type:complete